MRREIIPSESKMGAEKGIQSSTLCRLGTPCRQRILQWARRHLGDSDDAEDLCQEICIHCALGQAAFSEQVKFTTWLYRVMVNACHDHLRKNRRKVELLETDIGEETLRAAQEAQLWEQTGSEEAQIIIERVRVALSCLTPRQRQLMEWKYIEEVPHAEIARRMDMKEQSARAALQRAREAFIKAYLALDEEES